MFEGYFNAEEKTNTAFNGGWCTLGDLGKFDEEGYLYIVDRIKDVIKSGGVNIYPSEIEEVLHAHHAVEDVAVIGIPHLTWGESVHAILVLKQHHHATEEELNAHMREQLSGYKIPKSMQFRESLPRSAAGKILKRELRDEYWQDGIKV
jgi:acyl-CoA synthetase (AMP-forming)/AMP-acid ligase II